MHLYANPINSPHLVAKSKPKVLPPSPLQPARPTTCNKYEPLNDDSKHWVMTCDYPFLTESSSLHCLLLHISSSLACRTWVWDLNLVAGWEAAKFRLWGALDAVVSISAGLIAFLRATSQGRRLKRAVLRPKKEYFCRVGVLRGVVCILFPLSLREDSVFPR